MIKTGFLTLLTTVLLTGTAHAAFEWVPPIAGNAPVSQDTEISADFVPLPPKEPVISEPIAAPAPAPVPQPVVVAEPEAPQTQVAMASSAGKEPEIIWNPRDDMIKQAGASVPAPIVATKPKGFVEGFGRDIPLSIAVAQIVPEDFAVQYGQNVSPDILVNWQGGRDWKPALTEAVATQNLRLNITGQTVMIESTQPVYVAPASISPQPTQTAQAPATPEIVAEAMPPLQTQTELRNNNEVAFLDNPALFAPLAPVANDASSVSTLNQRAMWVAPRASTLRQVLTDWAREAGVQLQWSAQYDYPLMSDVQISGDFETAVENILAGLVDAQPRPVARLHPNEPSGPAILVVETRYIME